MLGKRLIIMAAAFGALGMLLAACGGGGASVEPLAVTIHAKDIAFDVTTLDAKVGQTVNVTYINEGALEHSFGIDGLLSEQKAAPGQTITFSFKPTTAGTMQYKCIVAGHTEAGMVGTLNVTP